jgi:hypothetical protein
VAAVAAAFVVGGLAADPPAGAVVAVEVEVDEQSTGVVVVYAEGNFAAHVPHAVVFALHW